MKLSTVKVCAGLLLITGLLFASLRLVFVSPTGAGAQGESLPQFTGTPGVASKGLEIWGRPNRSLYASLDSPRYVSGPEAEEFMKDSDTAHLLRSQDAIHVFPDVLMTSYHVVNDVIDGEPVAVTFCLLAGSSCLFSRRLEDKVLTFGLTGQLYGGNSVLYDHETETDWLQLNGEPLRGHYFGRARLGSKPLEYSTWRRIKQRKNLKVLAPLRSMEEYRRFQRDMEAEKLGQKVVVSQKELDPRLLPYTKGLGIQVQGQAHFYPEHSMGPRSSFQDKIGGWALLILQDEKEELNRIFRRRNGDRILDFELIEGVLVDRQTSSKWNDEGLCIEGPLAGARLETPSYTEAYWFVWASVYPSTGLST